MRLWASASGQPGPTLRGHLGWVALVMTVYALFVSWQQWSHADGYDPRRVEALGQPIDLFSGLLVYDNFTVFMRLFLFSAAALLIWLSMLTNIPDREDSGA